jgi:uncharacterized membrane protein YfcA
MTPADAALFALVTLALVLEAILGFGATVIVVTLGAQFLPLDVLLPTYVPVNLLLSGWILAKDARHVDVRLLVRRVLPYMGLGMALGLLVPTGVDRRALLVAFGALTMALALPQVWSAASRGTSPHAHAPLPPVRAAGVLALGGVVHGLFGSGGPMVVYFLGRESLDKSVFRATLSALWVVLSVVLIASFVSRGHLNQDTLQRSVGILPALALGAFFGDKLHGRVDMRHFRLAVYALLFLAGFSLVLRNLLA